MMDIYRSLGMMDIYAGSTFFIGIGMMGGVWDEENLEKYMEKHMG